MRTGDDIGENQYFSPGENFHPSVPRLTTYLSVSLILITPVGWCLS